MEDPKNDMYLFGVTIIVKSETAFIEAGPEMKPKKTGRTRNSYGDREKDHRG